MFPDFFVQAFKIIAIHLMRRLTIFMISDSNEQLQQGLEYTLLKPNCHSW